MERKRDVVTGEALGDGSHGLEYQHTATAKPQCAWQERRKEHSTFTLLLLSVSCWCSLIGSQRVRESGDMVLTGSK